MNAVKKKSKPKLIRVGDYFQTHYFDTFYKENGSVILSDSQMTDLALTIMFGQIPIDGIVEASIQENIYKVGDRMDSILKSDVIYLGNIFDAN